MGLLSFTVPIKPLALRADGVAPMWVRFQVTRVPPCRCLLPRMHGWELRGPRRGDCPGVASATMSTIGPSDPIQLLNIRVREILSKPGLHRMQTCWVKEDGRTVWKSVSILYFGASPGELTHRELHVQKWQRTASGFDRTEHWYCRDDEVDRLRTFVTTELGEPGDFAVMQRTEQIAALLDHMESGALSSGLLSEIASKLAEHVEFVSDISELRGAELLGMAVDLKKRHAVIDQLTRLVADPSTTEAQLQHLLAANWWLLGATYVEMVDRRQLTLVDQFDIPLIRADGVLHIVELKKANIRHMVIPHRSHRRVADPVNEAVNQAANYLREVDELRDAIRSRFDIECRRAQATVLIGHPDHNDHDEVTAEQYREAIRTYNSHLSRIEVLTYEDLLATARHAALALAEEVTQEAVAVEVAPDTPSVPARPAVSASGDFDDFGDEPF